jgi:TIR domain
MGNGRIFISYRRDDSAGYARAIHEQLVKRFAKDRVFMDVDSIEPGLPFDQVIKQAVERCDVLLAVIGKEWMAQKTGSGPRIDDPKDFVRIEIAAALSGNVRVIPVLLDGASMPAQEELPEPLRSLALRNAIEVSNSRFSSDVERLIEVINKILGESDTPRNIKSYISSRRPLLYWLLGGVAAVAIIPFSVRIPWVAKESRLTEPAQPDWRFCEKCQSMFFDGYPTKGVCPAGGAHSAQGFNFVLPHDVASSLGQPDWRFCQKCQSMFFDGYPTKGVCPAGGAHSAQGFNFVLPYK